MYFDFQESLEVTPRNMGTRNKNAKIWKSILLPAWLSKNEILLNCFARLLLIFWDTFIKEHISITATVCFLLNLNLIKWTFALNGFCFTISHDNYLSTWTCRYLFYRLHESRRYNLKELEAVFLKRSFYCRWKYLIYFLF